MLGGEEGLGGLDPFEQHRRDERCALDRLGIDRAALGGSLLQLWGLPPAVVAAVRYQDRPLEAPAEHADVVKLSGFFLYAQAHGVFAYWDTGSVDRAHVRLETGKPPRMIDMTQLAPSVQEKWRIQNLLGFGYTLVYRRAVWEACPFEPVFHGEDLQFTLAADDAGFHVRLVPDEEGISLCRRHADDHTIVFPQCLVPPFVIHRLFGRDALLLVSPDHTNT